MSKVFGPEAVGQYTDNTKVVVSFGASRGGFHFAMELRRRIYEKKLNCLPKTDASLVYMDTVSIVEDPHTSWEWDQVYQEFQGRNPNWKKLWTTALGNAKTIIFIITKPWIESKWCWEEFSVYRKKFEKNPSLRGLFLVFPDGRDGFNDYFMTMSAGINNFRTTFMSNVGPIGATTIGGIVEGVSVPAGTYNYCCSDHELTKILNDVAV